MACGASQHGSSEKVIKLMRSVCGGCCGRWGWRRFIRSRDFGHPASGTQVYPYLLRNVAIERVNQVWSTDITYIRLLTGFVYLVAIMDWYSRYVLAWEVSNTLEGSFCVAALSERVRSGPAGDIQFGSGSAVHESDVYRAAVKRWNPDQHGRTRTCFG